jgi:hypothetical protein
VDLHLGFSLCTMFLVFGTFFIGGLFSVLATVARLGPPVAEELSESASYKRLRIAIIVFTFGVVLGLLPLLPSSFPLHGRDQPLVLLLHGYFLQTLLPLPSFFAIAWSWYLSFRGEGPGKRIFQIGAVLVLCIDVLGLPLLVSSAVEGI